MECSWHTWILHIIIYYIILQLLYIREGSVSSKNWWNIMQIFIKKRTENMH